MRRGGTWGITIEKRTAIVGTRSRMAEATSEALRALELCNFLIELKKKAGLSSHHGG